jgi:hypothetical protein
MAISLVLLGSILLLLRNLFSASIAQLLLCLLQVSASAVHNYLSLLSDLGAGRNSAMLDQYVPVILQAWYQGR